MSELPFLGVRPGMFEGAMRCPRCGFATSDPNVYECPNCQMVWKERPKKLAEPGTKVTMVCSVCGRGIGPDDVLVFGHTPGTLAHENCMAGGDTPEAESEAVASSYLDFVQNATPIDGGEVYRTGRQSEPQPTVQIQQASPGASQLHVVRDTGPRKKAKADRRPPCPCPHTRNEAGRITGKAHQPECPRGNRSHQRDG